MKRLRIITIIATIALLSKINLYSQSCDFYLGQIPPTNNPILFPPPNFQANADWFWHGVPTFSPDSTEMYFVKYQTALNKHSIWFTKCENGTWSSPTLAPFSLADNWDNNPLFLKSNDTLYFHSARPIPNIYRVVRTNGIWSNPVSLNLTIPSGRTMGLQFSIAENGNIYSELENAQGNSEIYRWKKTATGWANPTILSGVNSSDFDGFPTIDPKERFLLFSSNREPATNNFDIFISFRNDNNSWTTPQNLSSGTIIPQSTGWTCFSLDGNYLFYTKSDSLGYNPYWIEAQFLYNMIPPKPYLGESPPTTIPKRFGPNYLQSNGVWWWISAPSFDSTGTEFHFTKYLSDLPEDNHQIYFMKETQGIWSSPEQPNFISDSEECSPFFSDDNTKIYFVSDRDGSRKMYFVDNTDTGYSAAQLINFPYDSLPGDFGFGFSITSDSIIYFTVWNDSTLTDLYKSIPENGEYQSFEKLPDSINSNYHDNSPYIAKDESYLIFSSNRPDGFGFHDLYISFKKADGSWIKSMNMGSTINDVSEDSSPRLSSDGKYLFFTCAIPYFDYGYNAYWVSADIIQNYKPLIPYFGETPPDTIPVKFSPDYVSHPNHLEYGIAFSPDGKECYFDRRENNQPAKLFYSKFDVNEWTTPVVSAISNDYFLSCEPCFSHDNQKLFFCWTDSTYSNPGISFVQRNDNSWTLPQYAGQGMFLSTDNTGVLYTTDLSALPNNQYLAKITEENGVFTSYERLNIQPFYGQQAHPCIAPDGSYIIFDNWGEDLYVSFKKPDGTWNTAIRLSEHGFNVAAGGPRISPCGNYLFFHLNGDIWWVDIDIINNLNPYSEINDLHKNNEVLIYPNPASDNITIDIKENTNSTIKIFNIYGQLVYLKEKINQSEIIDISYLNAGIYFIDVSNSNSEYQQKLIIE